MELIKGLPVAKAINEELINEREKAGVVPKLAIVRVGEREDDLAYERGALKKMEKVGFDVSVFAFPADIDNDSFQAEFDRINEDASIDGILLLRPLPKHLDEKAVTERIDPKKDIDGIGPMNLFKVFAGEDDGFAPCTAKAVIEILDHYGIDVTGKAVTVVGRSLVIGKPVAMMLMKKNATVTICHTKTTDMRSVCKGADIVVAAAGKAKMIDSSFLKDGAVVIDVGINVDEEGNLCGDVDASSVEEMSGKLTPVPGGVGSVTTSVLAKHLLKAKLSK
ncbi:MAG: bifunctional 5,10-methylenetetrahydrofolate dehydrogenase/5,10-methenyltetrahydrofolate cyclohydrolase [Lachnospiraceae bacterium]|nr:bifunctional 5,10-methylenetetrahydrofolate dehydrogenase/5,10-methenyltetrahydrofolate cyclohydrolase [Lachnospiraceae bacterium]